MKWVYILLAAIVGATSTRAAEIVVNPPAGGAADEVLVSALDKAAPGDRVV